MGLLELDNVNAGYGEKRILDGVTINISQKEIVGLVGPNGSGKSTVLKSIFGLVAVESGSIVFDGNHVENRKPATNVAAGIGYVPQGSRVFDRLTVQENLELGGFFLRDKKEMRERIEKVYQLFSVLRHKRKSKANKLSGGERQMLGIGRGLIMHPKLLLLDEPSIGLAPKLVKVVMETIRRIAEEMDISLLVVEQNVRELLNVTERVYLLKLGRIVLEDDKIGSDTAEKLRKVFLS